MQLWNMSAHVGLYSMMMYDLVFAGPLFHPSLIHFDPSSGPRFARFGWLDQHDRALSDHVCFSESIKISWFLWCWYCKGFPQLLAQSVSWGHPAASEMQARKPWPTICSRLVISIDLTDMSFESPPVEPCFFHSCVNELSI